MTFMENLVLKSEKFVVNYLNTNLDSKLVYHNLAHTQRVVEKVQELTISNEFDDNDQHILEIAAWFHDTGFSKTIEGHEKESVKIASEFLKANGAKDQTIALVSSIILATQIDYTPKTELEGIIKDADCAHVSSKNYDEYAALLKKELELTQGHKITKTEWINTNIDFLTSHKFHTNLAASKWEKRKGKNLANLLQSQNRTKENLEKSKQKKAEFNLKKQKLDLPERGIETMFRVALRNHITLSDIADTKANILLSVNAIIISLVLSNLVSKLDNPTNYYLIWPTAIFAFCTVASIVLSILATRPNITQGKFTKEDVANKKVNLLFFGNFHKMKLNEFEWAMSEMMQDRDYLYSSLTKDLYFLGLVLNRKYSLLRLTYSVFMIGIIVSVIAFTLAFYFSETTALSHTASAIL